MLHCTSFGFSLETMRHKVSSYEVVDFTQHLFIAVGKWSLFLTKALIGKHRVSFLWLPGNRIAFTEPVFMKSRLWGAVGEYFWNYESTRLVGISGECLPGAFTFTLNKPMWVHAVRLTVATRALHAWWLSISVKQIQKLIIVNPLLYCQYPRASRGKKTLLLMP